MSKLPSINLAAPLLLLSLLFPGVPSLAGGVDNGGGVAEKNVMFSYLQLGRALDMCLQSDSCKLTLAEKKLLFQIRVDLAAELKAGLKILFKSEKAEPGFFQIDGFVRIAKTGSHIGDTIFVNLDLLYPTDIDGDSIPLNVGGATALLVHELGHHENEKDHTLLDLLGSKVQMIVIGHTQELNHGRYQGQMTATLLDFFAKNTVTQVFISDGNHQLDASPAIVNSVRCFDGRVPLGIWLWNARWDLYAVYKPDAQGVSKFPLRAEMVLTCPTPASPAFMEAHHQVIIETEVKKSPTGRYKFASDSIEVFPIDCQESPIMDCH